MLKTQNYQNNQLGAINLNVSSNKFSKFLYTTFPLDASVCVCGVGVCVFGNK
jgi:hypothetical protein